jgi:hypothetical protein
MDEATKKENRALATTIEFGDNGFAIQNMAQATLVAETFLASQLVPAHFNSTAKIIIAAQAAKELGKPLWWGINNMYVVHGKVGIAASAVAGLILESGVCCQWQVEEKGTFGQDSFAIEVTSKRKGFEEPTKTTFSIADAKTAGLWTSATWKKYPKVMLTWRAITFHARLYYADVLGGAYTDMELTDMKPDALEPPKCDVEPRDTRRKKVESTETVMEGFTEPDKAVMFPVRLDVAEPKHAQMAGRGKRPETETSPPPEKPADVVASQGDSAGVGEAVIEAEVVETDDRAYDTLMSDYIDAGGTDFTQWAAEALCRSEEEVNSPEQFTPEMIKRLGLRLENSGI